MKRRNPTMQCLECGTLAYRSNPQKRQNHWCSKLGRYRDLTRIDADPHRIVFVSGEQVDEWTWATRPTAERKDE
jgi:hypothetical protein